ncbi:MAG: DUF1801 domain-containing protein [Phycisphaerales bacterium]|nr:DUF1801 domain-containing protein [Phycisphaerales bacterium]
MAKKAGRQTATKKAPRRPAAKPATPARRADFGKPVTAYFASLPAAQRKIAEAAHRVLLRAAPMLQHEVKWGIAQYLFPGGSMMDADGFALYATKRSVNLAVGKGGELAKKHSLLEGTGKSMRHVKLRSVAEATSPAVAAVIADAVALASR